MNRWQLSYSLTIGGRLAAYRVDKLASNITCDAVKKLMLDALLCQSDVHHWTINPASLWNTKPLSWNRSILNNMTLPFMCPSFERVVLCFAWPNTLASSVYPEIARWDWLCVTSVWQKGLKRATELDQATIIPSSATEQRNINPFISIYRIQETQ